MIKTTRLVCGLPALFLVAFSAIASAGSPTYTLILGARVQLGPIQGAPANNAYTGVSGLISDVNGDGRPDIVLGINGNPPVVYLNNGTSNPFENVPGVFVVTPSSNGVNTWGAVTLADVNGDGFPDLAIAGFNAPDLIYLNNGTAAPFNGATGTAIGTQDVAENVALGDVNGDGYPDMAVANTNHVASEIYLTNGAPLTSGNYTTVQVGTDLGYGQQALIADVNGDGKPDLILTYTLANSPTDPSGIAIYLNNGTNSPFANVTPIRLLAGDSVESIAITDLRKNGSLDLVASVSNSSLTTAGSALYVFLNTGSSSQPFSTPQTLQPDNDLGGGCLDVSTGDVNGDGLPDLLFACAAPTANTSPAPAHPAVGAIYLNNGTTNPFANVAPVDIPATSQSGYGRGVAVGTFVQGGTPDILVVDGNPGLAGYFPATLDQNPVAQNDSAIVAIDKSIQISVLANDSAGPGQSLNPASVAITTVPQHGSATVDSTSGKVTYQPATEYSGADGFQYTVSDGLGAVSNVASVSVTVQPAPVAANDTDTVQAGQSITINVLANDTSAGGTLNPATINIAVQPMHGTAAVSNGEVVYTPTMGYSGLDTFQYTVQDNLGTTSNAATVSIDVMAQTSPPAKGGGGGGAMGLFEILTLAGVVLIRCAGLRGRPLH